MPLVSLEMGHIPRTARRFSAGRLTIALTLAVMLVLPGVAVARRIVTGSTKTAIVRAVPIALPTPQRCLVVYVTTKDGGNWATVGFNNAMLHPCIRWAANGVAMPTALMGAGGTSPRAQLTSRAGGSGFRLPSVTT